MDLIAVSGVRSSFIDELRMVYEVEYAELKEKNWLDEMNVSARDTHGRSPSILIRTITRVIFA